MLTKEQYKVLKKYRSGSIPVGEDGLSEIESYLLEQKYIESAKMDISKYAGFVQVFSSEFKITELGRTALAEYEQKKKEKLFQLWLVLLGAILALAAEWILSLFLG